MSIAIIEKKQKILDLVRIGTPLSEIAKTIGTNEPSLNRYCNDEIEKDYTRARSIGVDSLVGSLLTIPDDTKDMQKARLKCDNIKWIASKIKPAEYGDRIEVGIIQTIDISGPFQDAMNRLQAIGRDQELTIDSQAIDIIGTNHSSHEDTKSPGHDDIDQEIDIFS